MASARSPGRHQRVDAIEPSRWKGDDD